MKPGTVVQLKSGGPKMAVASQSGEVVRCQWFDGNNQVIQGDFPVASLAVIGEVSQPQHVGKDATTADLIRQIRARYSRAEVFVDPAGYVVKEGTRYLSAVTLTEHDAWCNAVERLGGLEAVAAAAKRGFGG